jgi:hypothetical protein
MENICGKADIVQSITDICGVIGFNLTNADPVVITTSVQCWNLAALFPRHQLRVAHPTFGLREVGR